MPEKDDEFMKHVAKMLDIVGHKALISYGNPNEGDVDVLVISEEKQLIRRIFQHDPLYDLNIKSHGEFLESLRKFGKQAKEFRVYKGVDYVKSAIKETGMRHIRVKDCTKP